MNLSANVHSYSGDMPLTAVLGEVYLRKRTGTLCAYRRSARLPLFVFWFKRGFPCFSYSMEGIARLGDQFSEFRAKLIKRHFKQAGRARGGPQQLIGQHLISESLVSFDELSEALRVQINRRFLACAAESGPSYEFREGMDDFGVVPLSSPVVNPLEVAARAAHSSSLEDVASYMDGDMAGPYVISAPDRRLPPAVKNHLSASLLTSLQEGVSVDQAFSVPSQIRTLCFLHSFGFVEYRDSVDQNRDRPETAAEESHVVTQLAALTGAQVSLYDVLGLPVSATRQEVKRQYRQLAFDIHPDRVPPHLSALSREVFPRVVEAYHTLSRERLRVEYDTRLFLGTAREKLGDIGQLRQALTARRERLARAGYQDHAEAYTRMLASLETLSFGPPTCARYGESADWQSV